MRHLRHCRSSAPARLADQLSAALHRQSTVLPSAGTSAAQAHRSVPLSTPTRAEAIDETRHVASAKRTVYAAPLQVQNLIQCKAYRLNKILYMCFTVVVLTTIPQYPTYVTFIIQCKIILLFIKSKSLFTNKTSYPHMIHMINSPALPAFTKHGLFL